MSKLQAANYNYNGYACCLGRDSQFAQVSVVDFGAPSACLHSNAPIKSGWDDVLSLQPLASRRWYLGTRSDPPNHAPLSGGTASFLCFPTWNSKGWGTSRLSNEPHGPLHTSHVYVFIGLFLPRTLAARRPLHSFAGLSTNVLLQIQPTQATQEDLHFPKTTHCIFPVTRHARHSLGFPI